MRSDVSPQSTARSSRPVVFQHRADSASWTTNRFDPEASNSMKIPVYRPYPSKEDAMRVRQIMTPKTETIPPSASIQNAARRMRDLNIGCLTVTENGRLVGIVTDRDICCRAVCDGVDPTETAVSTIMSRDVMCCFDDQDVTEAAQLMEDKHVRRLAVLNRKKDIVGFVSVDDLALYSH